MTTVSSIAVIIILSVLSDLICRVFPALKPGFGYASQYPLILTLICFAFLPAIYEELVFRKLILDFLRKRLPDWAAVLLSSLVFAAAHMSIVQGITAFILGTYLAIVAIKTRSVIWCIYVHLLNNFLFFLYSAPSLSLAK